MLLSLQCVAVNSCRPLLPDKFENVAWGSWLGIRVGDMCKTLDYELIVCMSYALAVYAVARARGVRVYADEHVTSRVAFGKRSVAV